MIGDRRGVTAPVSYTLTLSIALVLVAGLLIGGTTLVDDTRDRTMQSQLSTIAQHVAGSVETTDRLLDSTDGATKTLVVRRDLPASVMGSGYMIQVTDRSGDVGVELESLEGGVVVWADMDLNHAVDRTRVRARDLRIRWDGSANQLVVDNA